MTSAHLPAHRGPFLLTSAARDPPPAPLALASFQLSGQLRASRKEVPAVLSNTTFPHYRHPLPRHLTRLYLSQVRTALPTLCIRPVHPAHSRIRPFSPLHSPFRLVGRGQRDCQSRQISNAPLPLPSLAARCHHASSPTRLTSPSSATAALTCARSDRLLDAYHKDHQHHSVTNVVDRFHHHSAPCDCEASLQARSHLNLVRTVPSFVRRASSALVVCRLAERPSFENGAGHDSEREINSIPRKRSALRNATRNAAAALWRAAVVPEWRPHQVGERL